jgi:integrase
MKLTDAVADKAGLPPGKDDVILFDNRLQGFGLRLRRLAKGIQKSWIVQYRDAAGKSRRFLIGTTEEMKAAKARDIGADTLANIRHGTYPHLERTKARALAVESFGSVGKLYLARRQTELRPRSFVEVKRHVEKRWSTFAETSIHHIDQRTVALRLNEIAEKHGKIEANRARATLSALFVWAMGEGIVTANPVAATNKAADEKPRKRVLSDDELAEVWGWCRDDTYGRIVKLLILTAQRREEVGAMIWAELDLKRGTWTLDAARTKNDEDHVVPLAPVALSILAATPRRARRELADVVLPDFVFSGGRAGFSGWSAAKIALDDRINAARKAAGNEQPMPEWRLHDLRRSAATRMGDALRVPPHIIEAILNHKSGYRGGISGVYNKATYAPEVRNALLMWADHIRTITDGGDRKVIPMRHKEVPA